MSRIDDFNVVGHWFQWYFDQKETDPSYQCRWGIYSDDIMTHAQEHDATEIRLILCIHLDVPSLECSYQGLNSHRLFSHKSIYEVKKPTNIRFLVQLCFDLSRPSPGPEVSKVSTWFGIKGGGHVTTSRHQHPLGAGQFLHVSRKCFSLFLYTIRQRKPRPYMFSQASSQASLIAFRLKWFSIGCRMSCM